MARRRYRTIIGEARFEDQNTGVTTRIDGTSWYIKNFNNIPGYFLRIGNTYKEFPAACFENTASRSSQFDFSKINQTNQENKDA